jgi:pimeloyl-ACP methyl ester carboxylesterase
MLLTMAFLELRNGNRLHYDVVDLTEPWTPAPTVFLHHGLGKSGRWWLPWIRQLAADFRVVTVDMLGCGRSDRPTGYSWSVADHAANVLQVLDHLSLDRVHFIGETVGGCIGLHLGAVHADRLRTLSIAACPYHPAADWLLEQSREIASGGLEASVDRDLPSRLDWENYPPAMYDWYRRERVAASARIVAEQYAAQAGEDLTWTLPRVGAPTLLFIPDESPVAANRQMREMAATIPDARVAELPPGRKPVWYHYAHAAECVAAFRRFAA